MHRIPVTVLLLHCALMTSGCRNTARASTETPPIIESKSSSTLDDARRDYQRWRWLSEPSAWQR